MRIGTIGTGFIVDTMIAAGRQAEGVEFVACYSRTMDKAEAFAHKHKMSYAFDNMDEFLNFDGIDTVYVASPNSLHYEQSINALKAGKHVIVEKPFTGNEENALAMIKTAEENNCFIFEAITNIHLPHFSYIQEELKKIGDVKIVQANFSQFSSRYNSLLAGENPNIFNPDFSGGALADINIYNLHLLVGLFGLPEEACYMANVYENGIDTSGIVLLQYENFVAEAVGAKDSISVNGITIQGTKGYIYADSATSILKTVKTVTQEGETVYNGQDKETHVYQFEVFKEIIETHDMERYQALCEHSIAVTQLASVCREQVGLYYTK